MNHSCIRISLNNHKACSNVSVYVKRGDSGRRLYITLTDGGAPYRISKDCVAVFTAKKPDGKALYNDCSIQGDVIVYDITEQTTAAVGQLNCEIKLYGSDGKLLTSACFILVVSDTVYDEGDEIESSSEYSALTEAMTKVQSQTRFRIVVSGDNGAYEILDKEEGNALTFSDIQAAIVAGRECYCRFGEYVLPLTRISGAEAWFTASVYDKEIRVVVNSKNIVSVATSISLEGGNSNNSFEELAARKIYLHTSLEEQESIAVNAFVEGDAAGVFLDNYLTDGDTVIRGVADARLDRDAVNLKQLRTLEEDITDYVNRVDTELAGKEPKHFKCTVSWNWNGFEFVPAVDKTYEEIVSAINAGQRCYCVVVDRTNPSLKQILDFASITASGVRFSNLINGQETRVTVWKDGDATAVGVAENVAYLSGTDAQLQTSGKAADAKAVGDALGDLRQAVEQGGGGGSVTVAKVEESTEDGGGNVVTFSDGNVLTVRNGRRGSDGEKGEKGDPGASGVYVGAEEPTDPNVSVWIDPDGEDAGLPSGGASAGEKWELIADLTTTEYLSSVTLNQDSNGSAFSLKRMIVYMQLPKQTKEDGTEVAAGYADYRINGEGEWKAPASGWENSKFVLDIQPCGDVCLISARKGTSHNNASHFHSGYVLRAGAFEAITSFSWAAFNLPVCPESKFTVYGVRA